MARHGISAALASRIRTTAEAMAANGDRVTADLIAAALGISSRSAATGLRLAGLQGHRGRPQTSDQDSCRVRMILATEAATRAAEERQRRGLRLSKEALVRNCRQAYAVGAEVAVWDKDRMGDVARPADLPNTITLTPGLRRPAGK